jgi:hypothetical protein
VGVNTESKLRDEVNAARVVVGLVTPSSLASSYVMFELGARWGAKMFLAPLLAGVKANELSGPLGLLNALSATDDAQLHQFLGDIGEHLGLRLQKPESYLRHVTVVIRLARETQNDTGVTTVPQGRAESNREFTISIVAEGIPPSQFLKVTASTPLKIVRLEYMLSNETCLVGEELSLYGETVELPINHDLLRKVWNMPRPDRNPYDHSGSAKLGVSVSIGGKVRQFIIPIQMESLLLGNTMYANVIGSKNFQS